MKTRIAPTQYEHATHMAICPEEFDWEYTAAMKRVLRALHRLGREHWIALEDRRVRLGLSNCYKPIERIVEGQDGGTYSEGSVQNIDH